MHNNCQIQILERVEQGPVTFMNLVNDVACVSETVDVFVNELKNAGKILERKSKFRILFYIKITK